MDRQAQRQEPQSFAAILEQQEIQRAALEQIERLSRTADGNLVDVPAMLGDIARKALS